MSALLLSCSCSPGMGAPRHAQAVTVLVPKHTRLQANPQFQTIEHSSLLRNMQFFSIVPDAGGSAGAARQACVPWHQMPGGQVLL